MSQAREEVIQALVLRRAAVTVLSVNICLNISAKTYLVSR